MGNPCSSSNGHGIGATEHRRRASFGFGGRKEIEAPFAGELSLDSTLRHVNVALSMACAALQAGLEAIHVPEASAPQVALDAGFVDGASPSSDRFSEPASAITHRLFKFPHPLQPISA